MRTSFIALTLPLAFLLTACLNESEFDCPEDPAAEGVVELSVSLPDGGITRTYLGDRIENAFPLLWAEGDQVSMNGTASTPVTADDAGKKSSRFLFRGSIKAPYNILYPATDESDKVVFPEEQNYVKDSFDPSALQMYASPDDYTEASMQHLGALLGFQFTAPEGESADLKQIIVMSIDGNVLAGEFSLTKNESGHFTGEFASATGVSTATLNFPENGLHLGSEPVTAWIGLPAGEYPKGFTALIVDTEDKAMMLNFMTKEDSSDKLIPGTATLFKSTCFDPGDGIFIIDEPEDLIKLSAEPTSHPEVVVVKNIDMSEVAAWTPIEGFNGVCNGAGHKISGLKNSVFGTLEGEVRNLTADVCFEMKDLIISALVNRVSKNGKISSCSATGKISVTGTQTASVYLGGLAAINEGEITGSTSSVELCFPSDASSGPAYIGGIVGYSTGRLSKLSTSCTITCAGTIGNSFCGSIAGYIKSSDNIVLASCQSEEGTSINLTYSSTNTPYLRFGGLFGYVSAPNVTINECINRTKLDINIPEEVSETQILSGGIAADVNSSTDGEALFSKCTNYGDINLVSLGRFGKNSVKARPNCLAGIIGKCWIQNAAANATSVTFKDCINNGNLKWESQNPKLYGQIAYMAGICADVSSADITDLNCVNNGNISISGYTDRCAIAGHFGIVWPGNGQKTTLNITGKGETPVNTGTLSYHDKESETCMRHPVAAGVVGIIMGSGGIPVEFNIKDCCNTGQIDRSTPTNAVFKKEEAAEASAGGIIGNIGFQSNTVSYGDITGTIENCSNTAQITINAFTREDATFHDHHLEKTASQSFIGGIIGFSHPSGGLVTVKNCSNSGYMRLTAGNAGGIVGRIQSNTIVTGTNSGGDVTYTTNTGRVGEFGLEIPSTYISTGYAYCGGIVGAMIYPGPDDKSMIEYCHNAGDIAGSHVNNESTGKGTARPTVGGIIGQYDFGRSYAAVRWCKNSGHTRCYRSFDGSSTNVYSGLISGSAMCNLVADPEAPEIKLAIIRDCAIGGLCLRGAGWTAPTSIEGEYPFYNYIYCYLNLEGDYPPTTEDGTGYAEGCEVWDGISKTSWEK